MRTALRSENPSDTSRWDTWSVPPLLALRPARRRSTRTKAVSNSGTTKISPTNTAGLTKATRVWKTGTSDRSEEHTSELQSQSNLVCRLLLEKKNKKHNH